ncbi:tRNA (guanine10-N2)-methyltransferase [Nematocida homosporus]|uniref:tRNA (guanine10-N2)-methyltransferase n=1 Tax=Nematocida homosporus TaxID=1912981 RepID=UPI00221FEF93|nr:tRNA (guanine10-N2)-methyltransferase [Nematocida homosporus]KAI5184545.1 tRNA (guanine10-N2)-methyltransferase [Nematocida homosporus]
MSERFLLIHPNIYLSFLAAEVHSILQITKDTYLFETLAGKTISITETNPPLLTVLKTQRKTLDFLLSRSVLVSKALYIPEPSETTAAFFQRQDNPQHTYRINVTSYTRKLSAAAKVTLMEELEPILGLRTANLTQPQTIIEIIETPTQTITGILYQESQRKDLLQYSLKNRAFIGTTAMDNEISFILANLAQVIPQSIVLDCFAGTGSLLLPCAILGALVVGLDSNPKQYQGLTKPHQNPKIRTLQPGTNIYTNFHQFQVNHQVLCFGLANIFSTPILRPTTIDAIICDPPYGRRESTNINLPIPTPTTNHKTNTDSNDFYFDSAWPFVQQLFQQAAICLKPNGFLCFFIPHANTNDLPVKMTNLDIFTEICRCPQYLNSVYSRTAFVYQKRTH